MRSSLPFGSRVYVRTAVVALAAGLLGACSSEMERFASVSPDVTNSTRGGNMLVPPSGIGGGAAVANAATPAIRPLGRMSSITSSPLLPPGGAKFAAPAAQSPILRSTPAQSAAIAASVPTGTARNLARAGNWTPAGGTPIVVAKGESLGMIERRYGVPTDTLLKVNGLRSASQVVPGTRLTIPVYDASGKITARTASKGDTTASIRQPGRVAATAAVKKAAPIASAAPMPSARPAALQKNQKRVASAGKLEANVARPKVATEPKETSAERRARLKEEQQSKLAKRNLARKEAAEEARKKREALAARKASAKPEKVASVSPGKPHVEKTDSKPVASITKPEKSEDEGSGANFRWPTKGRIIQGYRKGQNDGINIAVPEGTAIKAAEGGVVAYAGSELKGYGNLVLIRHPNGFVSAYAHNSQLKVKRGDQVRRGQTIAAAGRTGNVSTPQLHFELRKGANPVNPVGHLGSN